MLLLASKPVYLLKFGNLIAEQYPVDIVTSRVPGCITRDCVLKLFSSLFNADYLNTFLKYRFNMIFNNFSKYNNIFFISLWNIALTSSLQRDVQLPPVQFSFSYTLKICSLRGKKWLIMFSSFLVLF